jgi:MFS family permease
LLSQSITQGIGNGLQFCPTVALLSTYFARNRSIAIGIAASGSSLGGLIYPSIVRSLLPRLGFAWTVRVCGFVMLVVGLVAGAGLQTRKGLPARKSGPVLELAAFRELPYALTCLGNFLVFFGLFFAFYYVSSFARNVVGQSANTSFELLMVMNASGFIFRLLPALIADRFTGPLNLMLPFTFATALLTYVWAAVDSPSGTWAWAVCYGLIASGMQGLFPSVLSSLTTDLTKQGVRMGMGFAVVGLASATGPPVAGAIIQASGGRYIGAQMWAGTSIFLGACVLLAGRKVRVGWRLKRI